MLAALRRDKAASGPRSDQGGQQRSQLKPPKQPNAANLQSAFRATITLNGKNDNLGPLQHDLQAILENVRSVHPAISVKCPPLLFSARTPVIEIYSSSVSTANAASNLAAQQLVAAGWKLTSKPLPNRAQRAWRAAAVKLEKHKLEITDDVWNSRRTQQSGPSASGPPTGYLAASLQPRTNSGITASQSTVPPARVSYGQGIAPSQQLPAQSSYVPPPRNSPPPGLAHLRYGTQPAALLAPPPMNQHPAYHPLMRMDQQITSGNAQGTSTSAAAQLGHPEGYIQPLQVTREPQNTPRLGDPFGHFDRQRPALRQSVLGRGSRTSATPSASNVPQRRGSQRLAPVHRANSTKRGVVHRTPSNASNRYSSISGLGYSPTYRGAEAYEDVSEEE